MDHLMGNIVPGPRKVISLRKNLLNQVCSMVLALVGMITVIKKRISITALVERMGCHQLGQKMGS